MSKILNCVPNISEGRNQSVIDEAARAIRSVSGVKLIKVSPDADHNRTVYSFAGGPQAVLEAAKALASVAISRIDMSAHSGAHPRIGAVDVTPFIPVSGVGGEEALGICRQFGRWVGGLGIPVYYYGEAASTPARENLADVRKGQYEGLPKKLQSPGWAPDEGPAVFVPKSGAFAVGVRFALVAFNVNLHSCDIEAAKRIAEAVRNKSGGYRHVKAMAVMAGGRAQVSMNLTDYRGTPVHRVLETVKSEAARYGIAVAGTEIVGAVPAKAVEEIVRFYLQCHDFSSGQILEMNME